MWQAPDQDKINAGTLVQQGWFEDHFRRVYSPYVELVQYVWVIHERKDIIRRLSSEFGPEVGVDVTHHEINHLLVIVVHGHSLSDYTPYELVIVLTGTFLLTLSRVAVEYPAENFT